MKRVRAIVIDDDKLVLFIHQIMIEDCQPVWDTDYFPDASSALEFLKLRASLKISFLVFLDINMPGMSGWDMLDEIEKNPFKEQIFVILLTSSDNQSDKIKAGSYKNVKAYLTKPFKTKDFAELKANEALSVFFNNSLIKQPASKS
ncbi:response regulator [Pedobacter ginsengiterrae]|uniref:Response regulator n=1 Tax=Pedobacter ginsengiterrae TaxID=871696 RepID=A0ABP7PEE0_9SPHI